MLQLLSGDNMRDYLKKLLDEYGQIAENQINGFQADLNLEQFKSACEKTVNNLQGLQIGIKKILDENLYPDLEKIEEINNEDEEELFTVAQKLSSFEKRQDPGLALKIYMALLKKARNDKNDAKILKYLYWCGITQFFCHGHNSALVLEYFEEGAAYAEMYDKFEDPEIRQYVHRCLGNINMSLYGVKEPEKAYIQEKENFAFWNRLIFSGKDKDFPWLNYFLNGLNNRRSSLTELVHKDPQSETKEKINEILDVSISINDLYKKNKEYYTVFGGTRYEFHLWEAQFLSGLISFDNLKENIDKKQAGLADDDYSADAMYIRIQMNSYLIFYASKLDRLKDKKDEIVASLSKKTIDYFSAIPRSVDSGHINVYLRLLATQISDIFDPDEQLDFILKMTTFRHIPTHAHSIMVGKIAKILVKHLIDKNPEIFIGSLKIKDKEEAIKRTDELCNFAEKSGICHDIGKIACIENPYMQIRELTNEEYEIIKGHPEEGMKLLQRDDNNETNLVYTDVITGHHRYYDNNGGYPENIDTGNSENKLMIDIITAANSICAATDVLSRTYAKPKSLNEVCEEIKEEAGSRYSPKIAEILNDKELFDSINKELNDETINAYYTAYLYAWSGGEQ